MDKIADKIRKLLRKAEGASTPEEADAYSKKAERLMLEHSIDPAVIAEKEAQGDKVATRTFTLGTYAKPKAQLLATIAIAFGAKPYTIGTTSTRVVVYGWESDLETIATLFESLERQAMSAAAYGHQRQPWVHGKTFTTSFLVGFTGTVHKRLQAQRRDVVEETTQAHASTALVLVDRSKAVDRHVTDALRGQKVTKATTSQVSSAAGYRSGKVAGERADLGGPRLGGQARTAIR